MGAQVNERRETAVMAGSNLLFKPITLLGTNISPTQGMFEEDFPFPQVGYVSSLEDILKLSKHLCQQFLEDPVLLRLGLHGHHEV